LANFLIPIFAACPKALSTNRLTHFFGTKHARFLDPLPFSKLRLRNDWEGLELSSDEKMRLSTIKEKLIHSGAIKPVHCLRDPTIPTKTKLILEELNREGSKIKCAIVCDDSDLEKLSDKIVTLSFFEDENLFNYDPTELPEDPSAFFDHIPDFVIDDANIFKLVDPYFFEITSLELAQKSVDFISNLANKYFSFNGNSNTKLEMQIFGRKPKVFDIDVLKGHLAPVIADLEALYPVDLSFFVLNSQCKTTENVPNEYLDYFGKTVHERFFCADSIYFSFENTSQNRSETKRLQKWRVETSPSSKKFIDLINENGSLFEIQHQFNSQQLRFI